jgi:hypothetical protein
MSTSGAVVGDRQVVEKRELVFRNLRAWIEGRLWDRREVCG